MTTRTTPGREHPDEIRGMFNAIAPTYDVLNHLLSFGLDIRWRRKAISFLAGKRHGIFLDIAAGSGDVSLDLFALKPSLVVGADFAREMLRVFQQKLNKRSHVDTIGLVCCDAHELPFRDDTFDGTIVAFGIRNFSDRARSLREMHRVLRPGGLAVILELSQPTSPVVAQLYRFYGAVVLPLLGMIISRHTSAYKYLPSSIREFPPQSEFVELMRSAGFEDVRATALSFGAATIFVGTKPTPRLG